MHQALAEFAHGSTGVETITDSASNATLGGWLAAGRIAAGYSLEQFASVLRIQQFYLEALEREDFANLPARPYVSGYVRSFALRVNLDPREANQRLQQVWPIEEALIGNAKSLNFADPEKAGWLTLRRLAAGLLVAAIAGYAAWYFTEVRDRRPVALSPVPDLEQVPSANLASSENVPPSQSPVRRVVLGPLAPVELQEMPAAHLQQLVVGQTGNAKAPAFSPLPDGPFPRPRPDTPPALIWGKLYGEPSQAVDDPDPSEGTSDTVADGSASQDAEAGSTRLAAYIPKLQLRSDLGPLNPEVPAVMMLARDTEEFPASDFVEPRTHGRTQAYAAVPPGQERQGEASGAQAPVVLKAEGAASWIEIKDERGAVVLSRLLKAGQSIDVPNRPGLELTTGNAGALVVSVNGVRLPALGRDRAVLRRISLDPENLLERQE